MFPIRMNKSAIGFRVLTTTISDMDDVFREPSKVNNSIAGKKYSKEIIIDEIAQIKNYTIQAYSFADKDNIDLESKVRLIFSYDDWQFLSQAYKIKLKKGDLITFLGEEESNLKIKEIIPKSFLNGKPMLYYVELEDNTRVVGGRK